MRTATALSESTETQTRLTAEVAALNSQLGEERARADLFEAELEEVRLEAGRLKSQVRQEPGFL